MSNLGGYEWHVASDHYGPLFRGRGQACKNFPKGSLARVNIRDYAMVSVQTQPFAIGGGSHHNYNVRGYLGQATDDSLDQRLPADLLNSLVPTQSPALASRQYYGRNRRI